MVKAPKFWYVSRWYSHLLRPLGWVYHTITYLRRTLTSPYKCSVPVICVGNLMMGGSGKTPTVIALVHILKDLGFSPHILSRGYKGAVTTSTLVDLNHHTYKDVGDEPLLLAQHAPTWVGKNRALSAQYAINKGADLLLMDDGLQNPTLYQDLKLVVIDGRQGIGNGYVFPAGPLRERVTPGLDRVDGVVMINGHTPLSVVKPTFFAHTQVLNKIPHQKVIGFAGLGFPEKFRLTLIQEGYEVRGFEAFADHYAYRDEDIERLVAWARAEKAHLVTTAKDMLRVPKKWHSQLFSIEIELRFEDIISFLEFLRKKLT